MPLRAAGPGSALREIDRWEGGVGWIAHPEETLERASHALEIDGAVWLIDPVDAADLDDLLATIGPVAGVAVLFNHHTRDAVRIAARHDAPVYVPEWLDRVADRIEGRGRVRVERRVDTLTEDRYRLLELADLPVWREAALYDEATRTLVVAEALGNAMYFRAGSERLGVHPGWRLRPPRGALGRLSPDRVLVGHGPGVLTDAQAALEDALGKARRRLPAACLGIARQALAR